jgi:flagellar assembly protein FliH
MAEIETGVEWEAFEAAAAEARRHPRRIEKLAYRAPGTVSIPAQAPAQEQAIAAEEMERKLADLEARLAESERAAAARLEQARREGAAAAEQLRQESERERREAHEALAAQVNSALEEFRRQRDEYFGKVEQEVVKLALAIAARILNREASLDPLLLAGAVRVALGQLGETTGVRLRCPPEQSEGWRRLLGALPAPVPAVEPDPALGPMECVLETQVGSVDLGVKAQLQEIERGFFDLLEQRPGAERHRG